MEILIKNIKIILIALGVIVLGAVASTGWLGWNLYQANEELAEVKAYLADLGTLTNMDGYGTAHIHADFKMYRDGEEVELFKEENFERNKFTHFHPESDPEKPNKDVIHVHTAGITLGQFLRTLGVSLDEDARVYVNGSHIASADTYVVADLDKILVSTGRTDTAEIERQLQSVGDYAKTHSTPLNFECGVSC